MQEQAWPAIATGEHTLISAPTGSGKTLAAFLWGLNRLVEGPGHSTAFVVAAAFAGLGALLVFVRRRTFVTPVPA